MAKKVDCSGLALAKPIELLDHLFHVHVGLRVAQAQALAQFGDLRIDASQHAGETGERLRTQLGGANGLRIGEVAHRIPRIG